MRAIIEMSIINYDRIWKFQSSKRKLTPDGRANARISVKGLAPEAIQSERILLILLLYVS
jgi:hypothetical protein